MRNQWEALKSYCKYNCTGFKQQTKQNKTKMITDYTKLFKHLHLPYRPRPPFLGLISPTTSWVFLNLCLFMYLFLSGQRNLANVNMWTWAEHLYSPCALVFDTRSVKHLFWMRDIFHVMISDRLAHTHTRTHLRAFGGIYNSIWCVHKKKKNVMSVCHACWVLSILSRGSAATHLPCFICQCWQESKQLRDTASRWIYNTVNNQLVLR